MKKTLLTVALVAMATASFGYIGIDWGAKALLDSDGIATQNPEVKQIFWQLVYTSDEKTPLIGKEDNEEHTAGWPTLIDETKPLDKDNIKYRENDQVLATRVWDVSNPTNMSCYDAIKDTTTNFKFNAEKGKITTAKYAIYSEDSLSGGKIYSAVFQILKNGDIYWDCTGFVTMQTPTGNELTPADGIDWVTNGEGAHITTVFHKTVPEPATMSLLGLGALAMVIRRKLRK